MPLSSREIIATICPELSGSPSLPVYLEMAVAATSRGFFGGVYNQAVAYRAAHLFTVMGGSGGSTAVDIIKELGGGAPVASMSEGGLSVSFAQTGGGTSGDTALDSTRYGKMLQGLIKSRPRMGVNMAGLHCPPRGGYR
jgi:hypothetical protein